MKLFTVTDDNDQSSRPWENTETFKGFTVAKLRFVFDTICNQDDWKAAWAAHVSPAAVKCCLAAVEFFHADVPTVDAIVPITGMVRISGRGYQA